MTTTSEGLQLNEAVLDDEVSSAPYSPDRQVLNIFQRYVLATATTDRQEILDDLVEFYYEGYEQIRVISTVLLGLADITPYNSPIHMELAKLVQDFRQNEKRKAKSTEFPRPEYDSFLGQLLEDISDQRIEPLGAVQDGVDPLESANFDAFIAQLFALGIDTALCRYGEDAMHCAFVYDHSDQQQSLHDAYIITAAQWILVSSSAMYASCQENQWTLTMTKWAKWREGFLSVAEDAQHGAECRKIAERVADMMALEEKAAKG